MSLKRLLVLVVLAGVAATVLVSAAPAGSISDVEPCPRASSGVLICPPGTEGVSYSVKFRGDEDPICAPGDDKWYATNGSVPPGLTLAEDGRLTGTPTQAGTYSFWLELKLPDYVNPDGSGCSSRDNSEEPVSITINPGVPRLVIGPESAAPGTVGTAYALQMTATVPDPKTWSIVDGSLPPGLALGSGNGLISGTPTAAGAYAFTVRAAIADGRADTKALGIVVRSPLVITGGPVPQSEVGVRFLLPLTATGGSATYAWSLTSGTLPAGVTLAPTGGIAGIPEISGTYPFSVSVSDTEGRATTHSGVIVVADRLQILQLRLRPATVGRFYQARLRTTGGVQPATWRIRRGPLPRGMLFDRERGLLVGTPQRARTYRVGVEARDVLGVRSTQTIALLVQPAKAKRSR